MSPAVVAAVVVVAALVSASAGALVAARLSGGRRAAERARAAAAGVQRAEAAETERARLELALGAIAQGVIIADENGEVVFRNQAAEAFATGRHSDALVSAALGELLAEAATGLPSSRTLDLFGPPRRTLVITAVPLPSVHGTATLGLVEDISELRHLEAVRRDFVANISHELKTPIGALGLLAETLLAEDDPEVSTRLADRIHAEAFRVARTIDDLLELSRIESGEAPARERVAIHVVLAEAVERIRPATEHTGTAIRVREPSAQLAVLGDRRQLVSAVYNLLDNAVKYSDEGSDVEVGATTDGQRVEIAVADHGIGIPARDIERVFERFYRVDQARSRQTGGTGLGLAIVRHVMGNHEGEVRVESRLGEGSTFTLSLPTASGPVLLEAPAMAPVAEAG
jgi:two-component system sensor histidine kinase SenX3